MAIRITGPSNWIAYGVNGTSVSGGSLFLYPPSPVSSGSITVSFDGESGSQYFPITNKVITKINGTNTEYNTTNRTVSYTIDSFENSVSADDSSGSFTTGCFGVSCVYQQYGIPYNYSIGGDVYYNNVLISTAYKGAYVPFTVYVCLPRDYYAYASTISDIIPSANGFHGYLVAGITYPKINQIIVANNVSNDPNTDFIVDVNGSSAFVTKTADKTYKWEIPSTNVPISASEVDYTYEVTVRVKNARGTSHETVKTASAKGYHVPRLVVNTSGDNAYASRCDANGNADGLGEYGKVHLKWDVSTVDSNDPNELQTVNVVLNDTTTLVPSGGSIALGYLDYIFPLPLQTQGNITVTLTDEIRTNTTNILSVPKASMPMSLYDDGGNVGVAYGRMATMGGVWVYMPFYLQSSTDGSSKMFRIKVNDSGQISAEEVVN